MVRSTLGSETPEAENDLYVLLNSPRDAQSEQLRLAFRRLSQLYHPDKHVDPETKQTANDRFTQIKEAYEILSDEKLRSIYDEFGLNAAREAASPTMELTPYVDLVNRFRQEAASGKGAQNGVNSPRDAYFTVVNSLETRIDGTGLTVALEDGLFADAPPLAVVSQVGLSSMATAYISQDTTIVAEYSTIASKRRAHNFNSSGGTGDLSLGVRRQLSPYSQAELTAHVPLENPASVTYGFKAVRSLDKYMQLSIESAYDPQMSEATTSLGMGRSFSERHSASLSWATGAAPGVGFQWRRDAYDEYLTEDMPRKKTDDEDDDDSETSGETAVNPKMRLLYKLLTYLVEPMGWRWSLRIGAVSSFGIVIRRPVGVLAPLFEPCNPTGPGGSSIKLRAQVGMFGWEVEAGGAQRYVINDTAWGMGISCGSRGVIWKLKVSRGGHRFHLPVVLVSTTADAKTATLAAIASSLFVTAVESLIVRPVLTYRDAEERAEAKKRRAEFLEKSKRDAAAAVELLARQVETVQAAEEAVVIDGREKAGLIIARAVYGLRDVARRTKYGDQSFEGREIEMEAIEVGDCVQALVENSAVQVVSTTKSTLLGFWDPSAFGEKEDLALRIWYWFRGEMHDCLVNDMEPLELPLSNHKVSSWS